MTIAFADRADAGRRLAALLVSHVDRPDGPAPVVFGMARGGVPVAAEVADALGAPLEVVVVRKLGHPTQPELGLGAIGEEGVRLVNGALVGRLGVPQHVLSAATAREDRELARRLHAYRGDRPPVSAAGRSAVVVDDGLATGFTARAAIEVMRRRGAARVVLGVPVGPPGALHAMRQVADDVVAVEESDGFVGISEWYEDFHQVTDEEVAAILASHRAPDDAGAARLAGAADPADDDTDTADQGSPGNVTT